MEDIFSATIFEPRCKLPPEAKKLAQDKVNNEWVKVLHSIDILI